MIIRFGRFPKLDNGNDCDGAPIENIDGTQRLGMIYREIEWTRNAGMSERYTAKVLGYRLALFAIEEELTFKTLKEVRDAARKRFQ